VPQARIEADDPDRSWPLARTFILQIFHATE
jgi:hypothetical protein